MQQRRPTLEESFPQWQYWRELPGLVADGCSFTMEQAQKAYYKHARGGSAPLDPSLRRRLADDDGNDPDGNRT